MIKTAIRYDETAIKAAFGSRRYLLEACVEEELDGHDIPTLLQRVRGQTGTSHRQRLIAAALKTHRPTQVMKFCGLKKYSAEWWSAVVRLSPSAGGSTREFDLLLVGWNNHHGVQAVAPQIDDVGSCEDNYLSRIEQKRNNGYIQEVELEGISLGAGKLALPKIAGLPDPEPDPILSVPTPERRVPKAFRPSFEPDPEPVIVDPGPEPKEEPDWLVKSDEEEKEAKKTSSGKKKSSTRAPTATKKSLFQEMQEKRKKKSEW